MNPLAVISELFAPAAKLVDALHTSDEEKGAIQNAFKSLQNAIVQSQLALIGKQIDAESKLVETKGSIIQTEAKSDSWLTKNWRPLTMITFLVLLVMQALGLGELSEKVQIEFMSLMKIGIGGYVTGRSAEKVLPGIISAIKGNT